MNTRNAAILGAGLLLAGGGLGWALLGHASPPAEADAAASEPVAQPLPVPPVPPRVAEGPRYEQCLSMLSDDPRGAASFAETWTGGGEGATHCRAMAEVSLGEVETGARDLEHLATGSHAPPAARAAVYGQAAQAWLMAGNAAQAFSAGSAALALTPDDADLLIDRAVAAGALDRFEDALDDLTHALEVAPHRTEALVLRAATWRHLSQLDLAQDDVDRAIAFDPENAEALLERGILRERRNDPAGARGDWERAIVLAPDSATADLAEQNLALLEAGPARK
jgi:tetratricopeptide (TPR) repeat protein